MPMLERPLALCPVKHRRPDLALYVPAGSAQPYLGIMKPGQRSPNCAKSAVKPSTVSGTRS